MSFQEYQNITGSGKIKIENGIAIIDKQFLANKIYEELKELSGKHHCEVAIPVEVNTIEGYESFDLCFAVSVDYVKYTTVYIDYVSLNSDNCKEYPYLESLQELSNDVVYLLDYNKD